MEDKEFFYQKYLPDEEKIREEKEYGNSNGHILSDSNTFYTGYDPDVYTINEEKEEDTSVVSCAENQNFFYQGYYESLEQEIHVRKNGDDDSIRPALSPQQFLEIVYLILSAGFLITYAFSLLTKNTEVFQGIIHTLTDIGIYLIVLLYMALMFLTKKVFAYLGNIGCLTAFILYSVFSGILAGILFADSEIYSIFLLNAGTFFLMALAVLFSNRKINGYVSVIIFWFLTVAIYWGFSIFTGKAYSSLITETVVSVIFLGLIGSEIYQVRKYYKLFAGTEKEMIKTAFQASIELKIAVFNAVEKFFYKIGSAISPHIAQQEWLDRDQDDDFIDW